MEKAKILIVEDEAIIAMELESQLQSLGYEVTSVVNTGEKAIEKAEQDKPDLILMDIRIKGEMDGIEAAEVIRNKFGIPVVFSTAYLDQERIERAKITMPFGYVLKPIQERDLKVTLEMALYVSKVDAERRNVEQISINNEKQYRELFNSMLDGFALHEMIFNDNGIPKDYRFLKVNPAFERLTGLSGTDIIGKTVLEVLPTTEKFWIKKYGEVVTSGTPIRFNNYSKELGKYFEVNAYKPAESQFACVFVDITQRRQAEKALKESEETYRLLFETSNDLITIADENAKPIIVNKAWINMFGSLSEYTANPFDWIHPADIQNIKEKWNGLLSFDQDFKNLQYRYKLHNDTWRSFRSSAKKIKMGETTYIYIVAQQCPVRKLQINTDITI